MAKIQQKRKIGILGGTFSPIHKAHLHIAKEAMDQYNLSEVWFMVAKLPPHKELSGDVNVFLRIKMAEIATKNYPGFYVKDYEAYLPGLSYTADTLEKLQKDYPDYEFYFIMGEDSLDSFSCWKDPKRIAKYAKFLICTRSYENETDHKDIRKKILELKDKFATDFLLVKASYIPISSSDLREAYLENDTVLLEKYLDNRVLDYIKEYRVYTKTKEYDVKQVATFMENTQSIKRFGHCVRVADTAAALAANYLYPIHTAYITGLLHDCAKHMSGDELLDFCNKNNLSVTESEKEAPYLLHGLAGSLIAKKEFQIDEEMAHAIEVHTRGCKEMNILDKIIFVADYIEPGRRHSKLLTPIRIMSYKDIDTAIIMILEDTIDYLKEGGRPIDETTMETLNYYRRIKNEGN